LVTILESSDTRPSIIHLTKSDLGLEIHQSLVELIPWIYKKRSTNERPEEIPFELIDNFKPFVYRQSARDLWFGEMYDSHDQIKTTFGLDYTEFVFSGYLVNIKGFRGSVLIFNNSFGLTGEDLNQLYSNNLMPLTANYNIVIPSEDKV